MGIRECGLAISCPRQNVASVARRGGRVPTVPCSRRRSGQRRPQNALPKKRQMTSLEKQKRTRNDANDAGPLGRHQHHWHFGAPLYPMAPVGIYML